MYMILPSSPCAESRHRHVSCACIHAYMEVDKDRPGSTHTGRWCEKENLPFTNLTHRKKASIKGLWCFPTEPVMLQTAMIKSLWVSSGLAGNILGLLVTRCLVFIAANIQIKLVLHGILPKS